MVDHTRRNASAPANLDVISASLRFARANDDLPDQRPNREESQTDRGLNQLGIHRWLSFIKRAGTWQWPMPALHSRGVSRLTSAKLRGMIHSRRLVR
jgi:hypothetical protein